MNVSVQINTDAFNDAVRRYVKEVGVALPQAMRTQARLLFGRIIQRTYPKTRAQGRKAVARDIGRAVRVLRPQEFDSKSVQRLIRKRDYEGLQAVFERSGNRMRVIPFHPALHQNARDRRGRVRKETGNATLDREEVRAHLKRQQDHVGRAKGGWAAAFMAVGGKPSDWIARWATVGRVEDRLTDPVASFIRAENRSEWAQSGDDDRIVSDALQSRSSDILTDLRKRMERAAQIHGARL